MSEKIFEIVPHVTAQPVESCVKILEAALERARSGEVVGAVVVEQYFDSSAAWSCGGKCESYSMLGAVHVAQADLVSDHLAEDV